MHKIYDTNVITCVQLNHIVVVVVADYQRWIDNE